MNRSYWEELVRHLEEYIQDETRDAHYYRTLAERAPAETKEMFEELAEDEARHAEEFKEAYRCLTGRMYEEKPKAPPAVPEYREALKERLRAETHDYKKYGREFLHAGDPYLRDLFFLTRTDEAIHAIRIAGLMPETGST
ncbi:MAG: ferritin-like domain-containing protein [Firmicutes bacterium]|nr:ferritin-like domain-containing protein [Bacillota bacterium]